MIHTPVDLKGGASHVMHNLHLDFIMFYPLFRSKKKQQEYLR